MVPRNSSEDDPPLLALEMWYRGVYPVINGTCTTTACCREKHEHLFAMVYPCSTRTYTRIYCGHMAGNDLAQTRTRECSLQRRLGK